MTKEQVKFIEKKLLKELMADLSSGKLVDEAGIKARVVDELKKYLPSSTTQAWVDIAVGLVTVLTCALAVGTSPLVTAGVNLAVVASVNRGMNSPTVCSAAEAAGAQVGKGIKALRGLFGRKAKAQ